MLRFKLCLHSNLNLLPAVVLIILTAPSLLQEEVHEVKSALSVHGHNIKVTEVLKDGDALTFLIVSKKVRK